MKIAVLALQGAFLEHEKAFSALGIQTATIRKLADFSGSFDGIVLPGGESTAQGKLLRESGLFEPIKTAIEGGMPAFGTCAGLILLAKEITNDENSYFGALDVSVRRNAYGRQLGSFRTELFFEGIGRFPAVFIRAPYIERAGRAEVLASFDGKIVAVREKKVLGTAFHPELTEDLRVHRYFVEMIGGRA